MLVSIIVITYNSGRCVLETLESAYRQTYPEIELIVSDDCSTDSTFALCRQWVTAHQERFVRTRCIQTPRNGGVVWNYNHALKEAQGAWIKYIAGGDLLRSNCIERYMHNIRPNLYMYACSLETFGKDNCMPTTIHPTLIDAGQKRQVRDALRYCHSVHGSTLFLKRSTLIQLGGFDTQFPMLEDTAIVYHYLVHGYGIGIVHETLVKWCVDNNSVSHSFHNFSQQISRCNNYYGIHYCWRYGLLLHSYHYWVKEYINRHADDSPRSVSKLIGYLLQSFNLVHLRRKLQRH